jgi:hypothetical protein
MTMAIVIEQLLTAKAQGREIIGIEAGMGFLEMLEKEYKGNVPESAKEVFCGMPVEWDLDINDYHFIEQVAFNF